MNAPASTAHINGNVDITDLDSFVRALTGWHTSKVAVLEHMKSIPPGTEATFSEGVNEGQLVKLEGEFLEGFKLGLTLSLMELGTLPFVAEFDEEPEDGDTPSPAAAPVQTN